MNNDISKDELNNIQQDTKSKKSYTVLFLRFLLIEALVLFAVLYINVLNRIAIELLFHFVHFLINGLFMYPFIRLFMYIVKYKTKNIGIICLKVVALLILAVILLTILLIFLYIYFYICIKPFDLLDALFAALI